MTKNKSGNVQQKLKDGIGKMMDALKDVGIRFVARLLHTEGLLESWYKAMEITRH